MGGAGVDRCLEYGFIHSSHVFHHPSSLKADLRGCMQLPQVTAERSTYRREESTDAATAGKIRANDRSELGALTKYPPCKLENNGSRNTQVGFQLLGPPRLAAFNGTPSKSLEVALSDAERPLHLWKRARRDNGSVCKGRPAGSSNSQTSPLFLHYVLAKAL